MRAILSRRDFGEKLGLVLMFLVPVILAFVLWFFVFKPEYTDGLNYELNKDGQGYTVVKYQGDEKIVEIPAKYKNKPVVAIGEKAFSYNKELETVRIPSSVKTIESYAFEGCSKLFDITLESGTVTIEKYAFKYCDYITYLNIPDTLTEIEPYAFYGCKRIAFINVDEGNKKYHSAGNCLIETESKTLVLGGWESVIPEDGSVTKIGNGAFTANTMLTSIVIPNVITEIDESAFQDCLFLTSVTIPNSVKKIGDYAFYGCSSLSSVIYKGTSQEWDKIEIGARNISFEGVIRYFQPDEE